MAIFGAVSVLHCTDALKRECRYFPSSPVFPTVFTKDFITPCCVIKSFTLESTPYYRKNYISENESGGPEKTCTFGSLA